MSDVTYRYKWRFGDGDKFTEILDRDTNEKGSVPFSDFSDCHICVISNGTQIDAERKVDAEGKNEPFRGFLKRLIDEIIENTFSGPDEEKDNFKRDTREKLTGPWGAPSKNNDLLSKKFFTEIIPETLFNGQSLKGSFFEFNRTPPSEDSSTNALKNQTDDVDADAQKLIDKAIEAAETSTKKCVIFTGAPGTGKTYCVEEYVKRVTGQNGKDGASHPNWEFVQFHSSYDYTDFVEGLRPVQKDSTPGQNNNPMVFVRMDGIFKAFCRRAEKLGGETKYYFVIDEINRADLGRVFGELMYCFEKRGKEHSIATQYANLPTCDKDGEPLKDENGKPLEGKDGCFKNGFYIPDNVVIIGTMNDIDRSVETFDFALRRRFDWVEIDANKVMRCSLKSMAEKGELTGEVTEELVARIKKMNEAIADEPSLGSAFAIGHAYFKGYDGKNLLDIWQRNIEPILREYMRGRSKQIADKLIGKCKTALFPEKETKDSQPAPQPENPA